MLQWMVRVVILFIVHDITCYIYSGSGSSSIFNSSLFERRLEIVKDYSKDRHGLEVLFGLQISVARLSHPPSKQENQFLVLSRDS